MPPIIRPSVTPASDMRYEDLSGAFTRTAATVQYHRPRLIRLPDNASGANEHPGRPNPALAQPLLRPPILRPCPTDSGQRSFAEPLYPGSLIALSPPPTKRVRKAARPQLSPPRSGSVDATGVPTDKANSRYASDACSIAPAPTPIQWSPLITLPMEKPLEERAIPDPEMPEDGALEGDEDGNDIARLRDAFAPQIDVALPCPKFSPFSFESIISSTSATSTPALSTVSLTSTPSTATFSIYSMSSTSSSESGRTSSESERLAPNDLPTLVIRVAEDDCIGSHFSDDEDEMEKNDKGQDTPKSWHPNPFLLKNFVPPPVPPPKVTSDPSTTNPLCFSLSSQKSQTNGDESFSVVTPANEEGAPTTIDSRELKRRKRQGRLMSLQEIHLVKQSFMPTDAVCSDDYWV